MTTLSPYRTPLLLTVVTLVFAATHLAYEHFNGGVQSHHLLNRADLPAISNWLGLFILPVLGFALGIRLRNLLATSATGKVPAAFWALQIGALLYGATLAIAFEFDARNISSSLFLGLFLLAAALPIYRIEWLLGLVVGMTFTFGAVLPTLVATVFATLSFVVRWLFRLAVTALRTARTRTGSA